MEPGKIPHEIRHGELAQLGILPYQPYYGTHDATSLFVIVLSYLYHWGADPELLRRYLPNAEAAMAWIDRLRRRRQGRIPGVQDPLVARPLQPGLEGRRRRHRRGRRDARAIADRDLRAAGLRVRREGAHGRHLRRARPSAGRPAAAARGTTPVRPVQRDVLVGGGGTYYLGLNGRKEPIRSVASNAGSPAPVRDRAAGASRAGRPSTDGAATCGRAGASGRCRRTTRTTTRSHTTRARSGRTTTPRSPAGSGATGSGRGGAGGQGHLRRGRAVCRARACPSSSPACRGSRLASRCQYLGANVPQAWAAGSVFRFVAILCGLHATTDAEGSRLYVNPALPDWMPEISINNLRVGGGRSTSTSRDGAVDVLSNTSRYEVVARARRPVPDRAAREV